MKSCLKLEKPISGLKYGLEASNLVLTDEPFIKSTTSRGNIDLSRCCISPSLKCHYLWLLNVKFSCFDKEMSSGRFECHCTMQFRCDFWHPNQNSLTFYQHVPGILWNEPHRPCRKLLSPLNSFAASVNHLLLYIFISLCTNMSSLFMQTSQLCQVKSLLMTMHAQKVDVSCA